LTLDYQLTSIKEMAKEKEGKPKTGNTAASKTPKEKKAAKAAKKKGQEH